MSRNSKGGASCTTLFFLTFLWALARIEVPDFLLELLALTGADGSIFLVKHGIIVSRLMIVCMHNISVVLASNVRVALAALCLEKTTGTLFLGDNRAVLGRQLGQP